MHTAVTYNQSMAGRRERGDRKDTLTERLMDNHACVDFLQWALPQLHMRWPGFRRVRGQVCKRLERRLHRLGIVDTGAYQDYLAHHPGEWRQLDALCRITITRFYRDKLMYARLQDTVMPRLIARAHARGATRLRLWSIGCASGEEPYSVALLWRIALARHFPETSLEILASDADPLLLQRARQACYPFSSIKNLPLEWRQRAFTQTDDRYCLNPAIRRDVRWLRHDVRQSAPPGLYDLILCRNLVFTYFDEPLQRQLLDRLRQHLVAGGALVIGVHETLPAGAAGFEAWCGRIGIYQKNEALG